MECVQEERSPRQIKEEEGMNNDARNILPGDKVKVFDSRLFRDDKATPLALTMQEATVLRRYGYKVIYVGDVCYDDLGNRFGEPQTWLYPDVIDVRFHHDGRESRGHFTDFVITPERP
jgi:hypothetical protein